MKSMKKYKNLATLAIALSFATIGAVFCLGQVDLDSTPQLKKRVVFLTGDDSRHGSGSHEFYAGAMLLKHSLEQGEFGDQLVCEVVNNWPNDSSVFNGADLIVHYYPGNKYHFMNEHHQLIDGLAKKGVSQMFIHYGIDPGQEAERSLKAWTGAVYKTDYSTNPTWKLKSELSKHPINNGVNNYTQADEWYVKMDFAKAPHFGAEGDLQVGEVYSVMRGDRETLMKVKKAAVALEKQVSESDTTVFWAKQRPDGGRGIGVTGGHFHRNWANDSFRKQALNAIVWGVRLPVPEFGVQSAVITDELINLHLDENKKGFKKITLKK